MKKEVFLIGEILLVVIFIHGCAHRDIHESYFQPQTSPLSPETEDKVLSLDPESITGKEIADVLSKCPAPRIINLDGSIPLVTMESFSKFLILMGYPERSVRNPKNGSYSYSSYISSRKLAGLIAWHYEKEGMMPMVIGHSQGGMLSVKLLHEFAGAFNGRIAVWNPEIEKEEERYSIRDPLTGAERPVVGLKLGYASAIATGRLMRLFLGQWDMLTRLRKIPDTVEEFTGFRIQNDFIGSDFFGLEQANLYRPLGSAIVRNVKLPADYSHLTIPLTEDLAENAETREWINSYVPSTEDPELTMKSHSDSDNILFAAEIWHSIKKYWCIELQRLIRARRNFRDMNVFKVF